MHPTHQPYQPAPKPKRSRGRTALIVFGVIAALGVLGVLVNSTTPADDGTPAAKPPTPPAYRITHQDTSGNQRTVTVEVTTGKGLRAVFDAVAGKLTDDAGWFVEINCATGCTGTSDNRLANGRKAVGRIGAASTGLDDGKTEYEANKGATCPK